jgi:hypothetical protein
VAEPASDSRTGDQWQGWAGAKIEQLLENAAIAVIAQNQLAVQMKTEHVELRTLFMHQIEELDARVRPLEQLRLILIGFGIACMAAIPVIWLYASRINELLSRVDKMLPPVPGVKP